MEKGILIFLVLVVSGPALGCTTCNADLQKAIFDSSFYPNLLTMLSAFIVLAVVVMVLAFMVRSRERRRFRAEQNRVRAVPLIAAATTLGIAFGGFIDGIFFHQVLQWHEMLSFRIPLTTLMNKSVNMFWDGVFHAFCLIVAITGLYLLLQLFFRKDVLITRAVFTGGLILGWGIFNIVEGVIDHHLLRLHNVKETSENILMWNYGFLAVSVFLIAAGARVIRRGIPDQYYRNRSGDA